MKNVKFQRFQQGFADSSCMANSLKDMHAIKGPIQQGCREQGRRGGCGLCQGQLVSAPGLSEGTRPLREVGRKGEKKKKEKTQASEKMNQVYRRKSRSSQVTLSLPTPPPFWRLSDAAWSLTEVAGFCSPGGNDANIKGAEIAGNLAREPGARL